MFAVAKRFLDEGALGLRGRLVSIYAVLAVLNLGAWVWAIMAFHERPALLGIALVSYGLGLRHAVDADHIAAIDNVTRKLMEERQRPVAVGFFFALGHSATVIAMAAAVAGAAVMLSRFQRFHEIGSMISTSVSSLFLLAIAAMNIVIFASVYRSFRRVRAGGSYEAEDLDILLNSRGLLARLFRPLFRLVTKSWHMFPLGFLFALGFDTATEVAMFGASAAEAMKGVPLAATIVFPVLFAAGMSLVDTTDGVVMLGAYNWAFLKPVRKLYYNLTITLVSVVVALAIGSVEAAGLIADKLGLTGGAWVVIAAINDNFNSLGYAVVGILIGAWALSYTLYRGSTAQTTA